MTETEIINQARCLTLALQDRLYLRRSSSMKCCRQARATIVSPKQQSNKSNQINRIRPKKRSFMLYPDHEVTGMTGHKEGDSKELVHNTKQTKWKRYDQNSIELGNNHLGR